MNEINVGNRCWWIVTVFDDGRQVGTGSFGESAPARRAGRSRQRSRRSSARSSARSSLLAHRQVVQQILRFLPIIIQFIVKITKAINK